MWYLRKEDAKAVIKSDVGENYFEDVNLTFVVWEFKFLRLLFYHIKLLFGMSSSWSVII
jgi:hypothetical protein